MVYGILAYAVSLVLALSPIGEWVLRLQTGCKRIEQQDYRNHLQPLFAEALAAARKLDPTIPKDVGLFINSDLQPNAFATGRKTVCLTKGLLRYSDDQIKATFAHELGHLANKDTDLILLITIGNFIVTALFLLFRIFIRMVAFFAAMASEELGALVMGVFIDWILVGAMWIWTKLGTLLVLHSARQNEYLADEFAANCGYGNGLIAVLENFGGNSSRGLWANLASTHPAANDRIAKLQQLSCV